MLFEDETILVVNKPAGLLSVATNKMEDDTLHSRCVAHVRANHGERAWVHVVHRLIAKLRRHGLRPPRPSQG